MIFIIIVNYLNVRLITLFTNVWICLEEQTARK